jgi:hypothetical protein
MALLLFISRMPELHFCFTLVECTQNRHACLEMAWCFADDVCAQTWIFQNKIFPTWFIKVCTFNTKEKCLYINIHVCKGSHVIYISFFPRTNLSIFSQLPMEHTTHVAVISARTNQSQSHLVLPGTQLWFSEPIP